MQQQRAHEQQALVVEVLVLARELLAGRDEAGGVGGPCALGARDRGLLACTVLVLQHPLVRAKRLGVHWSAHFSPFLRLFHSDATALA